MEHIAHTIEKISKTFVTPPEALCIHECRHESTALQERMFEMLKESKTVRLALSVVTAAALVGAIPVAYGMAPAVDQAYAYDYDDDDDDYYYDDYYYDDYEDDYDDEDETIVGEDIDRSGETHKAGETGVCEDYRYTFNKDGKTVTITRLTETKTYRLTVPVKVDGYDVTGIAENAFFEQDSICTLTIPEGIEDIGDGAFEGCGSLYALNLPSTLKTIGESAFESTALEEVALPEGVTTLGARAFANCTKLTELSLPNDLRSVPSTCFYGCKGLKTLTIGTNKYQGASELSKVEKDAFGGCSKLKDVYYAYGASLAEEQAAWARIDFADGNDVLKNATVHYVDSRSHKYKYTKYGAGITIKVGKATYEVKTGVAPKLSLVKYSKKSKKVSVPDAIDCEGVTYQVTAIGAKAFKKHTKLTSVKTGSNVTSIGKSAFQGCSKLKTVTLGESVTSIGKSAFQSCGKLKTITVKSENLAKVGKKAFRGIGKKATLKAPAANKKAYKKLVKAAGAPSKIKVKSL